MRLICFCNSQGCECEDCEEPKSYTEQDMEIKPAEKMLRSVKASEDDKPADWPFMEQSGEVLADIPATWKQYPDTIAGRMQIIDMEYCELQNAKAKGGDVSKELVHLGSAALYLWRMINNVK